jgi:hypothetical protein
MRGSGKKSASRQAFEAVFEEQARRFSAFELLGLSSEALPPAQQPSTAVSDWLKETPSPDQSDGLVQEQGPGGLAQGLRPDGPTLGQTVDGLALGQTVWFSLGQTVWSSLGQTPSSLGQTGGPPRDSELRPDGLAQAPVKSLAGVLLAPLQWEVWRALQEAEATGQITSYRHIAQQTKSTIDGVRKAVRVLQKEGGILVKETVRTAEEQGFRVTLRHDLTFRRGTLNEAKAILKRGLALGQTVGGLAQALGPDGLRMYVCNNIYIRQTDIAQLLRIPPVEWKIREQTLMQIANTLPDMTAIEFRLSLSYLMEQAKKAKKPIRNPNAWIRAAFEKNGRPLVTEREIEARFEQYPLRQEAQRPRTAGEGVREELELLRRYLACGPDERAEIHRRAEEKAAPLLKVVAEGKRAGVIEEARLEAAREFFTKGP